MFDAFEIDPESLDDIAVNDASVFGRNFAQAGGLVSAIENYIKETNTNVDFKPVNVSGVDDLKKTMVMAKAGRSTGNFIEGMLCDGGCIGGAATMVPCTKSKPILNKFSNSSKSKIVIANGILNNFINVNLEK